MKAVNIIPQRRQKFKSAMSAVGASEAGGLEDNVLAPILDVTTIFAIDDDFYAFPVNTKHWPILAIRSISW